MKIPVLFWPYSIGVLKQFGKESRIVIADLRRNLCNSIVRVSEKKESLVKPHFFQIFIGCCSVIFSNVLKLGTGIVNVVNIFRPQLVLLGGGLAEQGRMLVGPLYDIMKDGCFGKDKGEIPEIEIAALGNKAGMIGTASLVQPESESPDRKHSSRSYWEISESLFPQSIVIWTLREKICFFMRIQFHR